MSLLSHLLLSLKGWRTTLWRTGEVPEDRQKVTVTPVFKKAKKEDPGNYRPVSFTSIPGKMMEQLILNVISKHMEEKKVIRSSQHGFTKQKSCLTNLLWWNDWLRRWGDYNGCCLSWFQQGFWHSLLPSIYTCCKMKTNYRGFKQVQRAL